MVTLEFASWLFPIVEVETKEVPLKLRSWPVVYEVALLPPLAIESAVPSVRPPLTVNPLLKMFVPLKVLLLESRVELAAAIV